MGIVDFALQFIADYGLLAVFVLLVLDNAMLLPVFPGEIVLIMAVGAFATDPGMLILLIALTTVAGVLGSLLLYGICRSGGSRLVEKYPWLFMMSTKKREKLEASFQRPAGQTAVLFLRFVPLTRIIVNIPAGLAKMPIGRFIILTTIGLAGYHGAFLWFTYEANRPGSTIATQREQLEQAYGSPAWEFVQTNQIIAGIGLLLVGIIIAARAAIKMHSEPEETGRSMIGFLTTVLLIWGSIALIVASYIDPDAVYALLALGGVNIQAVATRIGAGPVTVLWIAASIALLFGIILSRMRTSARRRRDQHNTARDRVVQREAIMRRNIGANAMFERGPPAPKQRPDGQKKK